ncbi:MAG TPA: hypothetical protein VEV20_05585 [Burkholderiales bacterium]|nr:hypothetical protein [Burkholderiales bacterium]
MQHLLALAQQYGLAFVFLNVLAEQAGLPVPAVPTLIIAGALAADATLSGSAVFAAAIIACVDGPASAADRRGRAVAQRARA